MSVKTLSLLIACFICFVCNCSIAQQAKLNWLADAKGYLNGGDMTVNDFAQDSDESIAVVGSFERTVDFAPGTDTLNLTAATDADIFIAKYSRRGSLEFVYQFGNKTNTLLQTAEAIAVDKQGNLYVTGTFGKTIDFDPGPGEAILSAPTSNEIFVVSYTASGVFRYAIDLAANSGQNLLQTGKSIAVDDDENVYVTGTFAGKNVDFDPGPQSKLFSAKGAANIFLAKYDKYGNYVFNDVMYGGGRDDVNKLELDNNGNTIICGYYQSSKIDFDPGPDSSILALTDKSDIFFSKYDRNGKYIFAKKIGGSRYDRASSLAIAKNNSIVLTGTFEGKNVDFDPGNNTHILSSISNDDVFFSRYDESGNYIFAASLQSYGNDDCYDVAVTAENNIVIVGQMSNNKVDFDPGPDSFYLSGQNTFSFPYTAQYTLNGKFVSAGKFTAEEIKINCISSNKNKLIIGGTFSGNLDVDASADSAVLTAPFYTLTMFLSQYDLNGKYVSSFSADGYISFSSAATIITSSVADVEGNIYASGYFQGIYDFDPGPGIYYLNSSGSYNGPTGYSGFFIKYSKNGKLLFAKALIGANADINSITVDKHQNVYLTGKYTGFDLDPSEKVYRIEKIQRTGYFISKYDRFGNFVFAGGEPFKNSNDNNVFKSIVIDSKNNICIAGWFSVSLDFDLSNKTKKVTPAGNTDMFFLKYDTAGNLLVFQSVGTKGSVCAAKALKMSADDEFILSGIISTAPADFDPGPAEKLLHTNSMGICSFIAKYTANGQLGFAFDLEPSSGNILAAGNFYRDVDFDPGNKIYTLSNGELFFASYTSNGELNFAKCIQNSSQSAAYTNNISAIAADTQGGIYLAGYFYTAAIDCDPDSSSSAILKNEFPNGGNNSEIFLARYDSSGNYITCFNPNADSAAGNNFTGEIFVTNNNAVVLTGAVTSKTDFDPSVNKVFLQPTSPYENLFVVKYSQGGHSLQQDIPVALKENNSKRKTISYQQH